ncbi:hypothetical protein CF336_g4239 [Tilletia laevis]|uniref:Uncharacterized protein n=1 Tax=Tilletia caries TaxID=13290 RepID=A0A177SXB0_9BASI|nr:hypothetical protein CF328_g8265 [Tilletia controversa]KAE8190880.1 hypothetical protein CF335_g6241 [Tilletia laevis]KAE8192875.1 hypothetical protein CF336_g4239 [Tilletia laevis]KAE8240634.1 hypothetical protein A4X03_0g8463 [Tilletia caries]
MPSEALENGGDRPELRAISAANTQRGRSSGKVARRRRGDVTAEISVDILTPRSMGPGVRSTPGRSGLILTDTAGRERVTGHCFRIGVATFFFSAEKPLDDIRIRGGWESDAYLVYIRDSYVRHAELFGDVDATHLFYG